MRKRGEGVTVFVLAVSTITHRSEYSSTWIPGVLQVLSTQVLECPAEGEESDAVTVVFSVRTFAGPPLHGL